MGLWRLVAGPALVVRGIAAAGWQGKGAMEKKTAVYPLTRAGGRGHIRGCEGDIPRRYVAMYGLSQADADLLFAPRVVAQGVGGRGMTGQRPCLRPPRPGLCGGKQAGRGGQAGRAWGARCRPRGARPGGDGGNYSA